MEISSFCQISRIGNAGRILPRAEFSSASYRRMVFSTFDLLVPWSLFTCQLGDLIALDPTVVAAFLSTPHGSLGRSVVTIKLDAKRAGTFAAFADRNFELFLDPAAPNNPEKTAKAIVKGLTDVAATIRKHLAMFLFYFNHAVSNKIHVCVSLLLFILDEIDLPTETELQICQEQELASRTFVNLVVNIKEAQYGLDKTVEHIDKSMGELTTLITRHRQLLAVGEEQERARKDFGSFDKNFEALLGFWDRGKRILMDLGSLGIIKPTPLSELVFKCKDLDGKTMIFCSTYLVEQVFNELMANARRALAREKETGDNLRVQLAQNDEKKIVMITVANRVFDNRMLAALESGQDGKIKLLTRDVAGKQFLFYRGETSRAQVKIGAGRGGIGLDMAWNYVHQMGGEIWAEWDGKSFSVMFTLRLANQSPPQKLSLPDRA